MTRSSETAIDQVLFVDDGRIPNNAKVPLTVYRKVAIPEGEDHKTAFTKMIARNGWTNTWHGGVASYHHFHSIAHELLAVYRGRAQIRLGGEDGQTFLVEAGDVVLIPSGVGHRNLGCSIDFRLIGSYPAERPNWDMRTINPAERSLVLKNLSEVPPPEHDPITGEAFPIWYGTPTPPANTART